MSEALIRSLPIWKHGIRIEPLGGGLTNWNCRVTDGEAVYAARAGDDDPRLGISRQSELRCAQIAGGLGIAPAIVYADKGVMVTEFIPGPPVEVPDADGGAAIRRIVELIDKVHRAGPEVTGHLQYFSAFQVARTYIADARSFRLTLPEDAETLLARINELEHEIAPFHPTFCHNDLMPGNILDTGERLWLIDWEYGGIGHPMFDLGGLSNNFELDADQDEALLAAYFGRRTNDIVRQFRVMKAMAALRESLWAVVHGSKSEIAFDYDNYRDENYDKLRRVLAAVP